MTVISEEKTKINVTLPKGDVHAGMEIFYNPIMKSNRNISILLLNSIANKNMNIADPLAGSGIRSLRFLQELKKGKIKQLF
jgi:tRNA G26 N,N-dimethylase Trm1